MSDSISFESTSTKYRTYNLSLTSDLWIHGFLMTPVCMLQRYLLCGLCRNS
jgi:hypothetical protein